MKKHLSHYDPAGSPRMVDVSAKSETRRTARAHAFVRIAPAVLKKLPANPKGNPLEIALAGATSEDVDSALGPGKFGMAEETGRLLNEAINTGVERGLGIGQSVSQFLAERQPQFPPDRPR
jgi:hypothetical protein